MSYNDESNNRHDRLTNTYDTYNNQEVVTSRRYPTCSRSVFAKLSLLILIYTYVAYGIALLFKHKTVVDSCIISHIWFYVLTIVLITGLTKPLYLDLIYPNVICKFKISCIGCIMLGYNIIDTALIVWGLYEYCGIQYYFNHNSTIINTSNINSTSCMDIVESDIGSFTFISIFVQFGFSSLMFMYVFTLCCKNCAIII